MLRLSQPLRELTTLKVGGVPNLLLSVENEEGVLEAIALARREKLPLAVLGGGSNILAREGEIPVCVLKMEIPGVIFRDEGHAVLAEVGAGVLWDTFVAKTVEEGFWGVENLSGIPGTVGAAPIQNIGAYGVEIGDVLVSLSVYDLVHRTTRIFSNVECDFKYRNSFFQEKEGRTFIITKVVFRLSKKPKPRLQYHDLAEYFSGVTYPCLKDIRGAVLAIRAKKFPDLDTIGTAGSFFKNPTLRMADFEQLARYFPGLPSFPSDEHERVKVPLAYILEALGFRGKRIGDVGMSEDHALVLVNYGGATYDHINSFAEFLEGEVYKKTGLTIEREVIIFP